MHCDRRANRLGIQLITNQCSESPLKRHRKTKVQNIIKRNHCHADAHHDLQQQRQLTADNIHGGVPTPVINVRIEATIRSSLS